jgi:uncharacterized iron-regulated protein
MLLSITHSTHDISWPKFYQTYSKRFISQEEVIDLLVQNQIIFIGEYHDHIWGHQIEYKLLTSWFGNLTLNKSQKPLNLAVSLEMFERDTQSWVDGYLNSQVSEQWFLNNSRPWSNYQTDYKPLVDFVKSKKQNVPITVLAANVPRRYAAFVASGNEDVIFKMPDVEKSYMAPKIYAPHDQYYENFYNLMKPSGWDDSKIERYYRAQCLKDDTMAMSIQQFFESDSFDNRVISYTGAFHVDYHLGLVTKAKDLLPSIKHILLSIVPVDPNKPLEPAKFDTLADIVVFAPENPKE